MIPSLPVEAPAECSRVAESVAPKGEPWLGSRSGSVDDG